MAPSASKQKRLAEKMSKASAKQKGEGGLETTETSSSTPLDSNSNANSSNATPITSARGSTEDLSMAKLAIKTDRCALSSHGLVGD